MDYENENKWKIQIFNNNINEYVNYIISCPTFVNNKEWINISGFYFGSSTRIDEIGTFYIEDLNIIIPLKIRVLDNTNQIIYEIDITKNMIENILINPSLNINPYFNINDNIYVYYRRLHRFNDCPYEISGIKIKL